MNHIEPLKISVLPLARPTFDVPFAEETCRNAWNLLEQIPAEWSGSKELLFDAGAVEGRLEEMVKNPPDLLLVLQLTFTDATMTVKLAETLDAPMVFWSFPEERTGGRLRLNSLCGINLASHALGKSGMRCDYLHIDPQDERAGSEIQARINAHQARKNLSKTRLAVLGQHPDGFHTCAYDAQELKKRTGVTVDQLELKDLFDEARQVPENKVEELRQELKPRIEGLEKVEQVPLDKSLRVLSSLKSKASNDGYQGFSIRCWPEFFTEYGCAACGAMGMLNTEGIAAGCEADVYGTLSTLILNWMGEEPAFIADLVDIDADQDTGVFWHCGLAPLSMADPEAPVEAGIHSNRKKPLVNEFPLKAGRVTLFRLSQSQNLNRMIIGGGTMLKAPKSFSGTSGVIRFDRPASEVLETVMKEGLEHHYGIAYGDLRHPLKLLAQQLDLPVFELT